MNAFLQSAVFHELEGTKQKWLGDYKRRIRAAYFIFNMLPCLVHILPNALDMTLY